MTEHLLCTACDIAEAARFLKLLDPTATEFEFRTFDDNKNRKDKNLTRTFFGSLAQHGAKLNRLNDKGAGVFVVINETNGVGRETENIIRVRALFVDLDGAPLAPVMAAKLKPHIVIESSPERWHVYWRVDNMPLDNFTPVQRALIDLFKSDKTVVALAGVMWLPGFYHHKAEPFPVSISSALDTPAYPATYFKLAKQRKRSAPGNEAIEINVEKVIAALEAATNDDVDEDLWFRIMAAAYVGSDGDREAFKAFAEYRVKVTPSASARSFRKRNCSLGDRQN
jgi:hypothetical protein